MAGNCETMGNCAFNILFTESVPHILEKIFFPLDYESFKSCMEVSKPWRSLLTSQRYQLMGESMFRKELQRDLWQAARQGDSKEVREILSNFMVDINCVLGYRDTTSLSAASWLGHKEVIHVLLDRGADPKKADKEDWTPLHYAAWYGSKAIVQLLLDRGVDPEAQNKDRNTALHLAAETGQKDVVQLLLERGANPNAQNDEGNTALHEAAYSGHKDVVQLLLDKGANPKALNDDGNTALYWAAYHGHKEVVQLLPNRGADPTRRVSTLNRVRHVLGHVWGFRKCMWEH